jgi:hypothetical protein
MAINTTKAAKAELSNKQLLGLLSLAGKYISATKNELCTSSSNYNRLVRECEHYDINMNFILAQAKDYFKRKPDSKLIESANPSPLQEYQDFKEESRSVSLQGD